MKHNHLRRDAVNTFDGPIHMVYDLDDSDEEMNWLFEGLSHVCATVWQLRPRDILRPLRTRCGIQVATHIERKTANLYNLAPVKTTCIWCLSGKDKE